MGKTSQCQEVKPSDLLDRLSQGEDDMYREIYEAYGCEFLDWAIFQYHLDHDEANDLLQEALANLYVNVYSGHLEALPTCSLKTYIYAIAKNHMRKRYHYFKNTTFITPIQECQESPSYLTEHPDEQDRIVQIKEQIENLDQPCKSLLKAVYLENGSYEAIATQLGYKNVEVLKTKKCRCLRQLRERVRFFKTGQ